MSPKIEFDIGEHWRILLRRKGWATATFVVVFVVVLLITIKQSPLWESSAVLRICAKEARQSFSTGSMTWYGILDSLGTEVHMIEDYEALHAAAAALIRRRAESGQFDPALTALAMTTTASSIRGGIKVTRTEGSDMVRISVTGGERQYVMELTKALVDAYREDYKARRTEEATKALRRGELRLSWLDAQVAQEQDAIRRYEQEHPRLGTGQVYKDRLTEIDAHLMKVRQYVQDDHPDVVQLRRQRQAMADVLAQLPEEELQYARLIAHRETFRQLQSRLAVEMEYAKVELSVRASTADKQVTVISAPSPARKLRPNITLNLGIGLLLGLTCAVMAAFVVETMDTSIGRVEDIEETTGLSVMALIPYMGQRSRRAFFSLRKRSRPSNSDLRSRLVFNQHRHSQAVECYRSLRESIISALAQQKAGNVLMVTSTAPREGKTLTTLNLSFLSVQMGRKVLLIEAEMRNPRIHRFLSVPRSPGLSDVLLGRASFDDCVRGLEDLLVGTPQWDSLLGVPNVQMLNVLTSGTVCPNPAELLASPAMGELVRRVSGEYDMVYVDTPPVMPVVDTFVLGDYVRACLVVYTVGGVSRHLLRRSLKLLRDKGVNVLGIVLNQIESDVHLPSYYKRAYGGYYGYGYGYYTKP